MKNVVVGGTLAVVLGIVGCAGSAGGAGASAEGELQAVDTLRCDAENGAKLGLVAAEGGKRALVTLTPAGDLLTVSSATGAYTATASGSTFTGAKVTLSIGAGLAGTWTAGTAAVKVSCAKADRDEATAFALAKGLAIYAGEIDGLASTVTDEMQKGAAKPYAVFAVPAARAGALDLGTEAKDSAGALPGTEDEASRLDENEWSYGGISAAYGLGGGEDYGEWFQGASDGVSLLADVQAALPAGAKVAFSAREKVRALGAAVDAAAPAAVVLSAGGFTFLLPDTFSK